MALVDDRDSQVAVTRGFPCMVLVVGACAVWVWLGLPVSSQTQSPSTGLSGRITSADGKPLEGVAVSAKAVGSTMTTSVWTNQQGDYYFPPLPEAAIACGRRRSAFD